MHNPSPRHPEGTEGSFCTPDSKEIPHSVRNDRRGVGSGFATPELSYLPPACRQTGQSDGR